MKHAFKPTPGGWERRKLVRPKVIDSSGNAQIMCPFCPRPHPLPLDGSAACGTRLDIRAIQKVYKGIACVLCGGQLGTMVKVGDKYRHAHDCTPSKQLYAEPPPLSRSAALVWRMPAFIHQLHALIWKRTAIELKQADKVVGYAWERVEIHGRNSPQVPG